MDSRQYGMPPSDSSSAPQLFPLVIPDEQISERRGTVAFMGSVARNGVWDLPRNYRILSVFGNVELDLASVRLGPGVSHVEIVAVFGNVEIRVPPGIRLECDGHPFLGNFEVKRNIESTNSPDAPIVRITGSAYLSSIEVKVVDPNARGFIAKFRARWSGKESR